jgi:hypothetical protein
MGNAPTCLKKTELSLKHFPQRMGQTDVCAVNQWKKVWVAGFLEKKHRSVIQGHNPLKQLRDGPLHLETAVAHFWEAFKIWLHLHNFVNGKWIQRL